MTEAPAKAPPANPSLLRAAAGALLVSLVPWAWMVLDQFRSGAAPLAAWNALAALPVLLTAFLLWKGNPRAAGATPVQAYYLAGFCLLWALRTRFWLLWAGVAAPAAAILLTMAWRSGRPAPAVPAAKGTDEAEDSFGPWIKENVEAIVIAFVMALVIRCFCIEVFKIPSSSMEPTLMGDKGPGGPGGDRIMVTKYYYTVSDIERFDVVVFKFPLNQPKNFIKRVVGLPGEELKILDGDLYARRKGEDRFRIARKSLRIQDSLWIHPAGGGKSVLPLADGPAFGDSWKASSPGGGAGHAAFEVRGGELTTQEKDGQRDVKFSFRDFRDDGGRVKDVRLSFDFEATSPRGLVFVEAQNSHGTFEGRLSADGTGTFERRWVDAEGPHAKTHSLPPVRIALDRRYRVDLSVYDGTAVLRMDGSVLAEIPFIETEAQGNARNDEATPSVSFGARGLTFRVRDLEVGRDICYRGGRSDRLRAMAEDRPIAIPEDHFVMMGDNVSCSHDSRVWTCYTYPLRGRAEPVRCEGQETTESSTGDSSFLRRIAEKYRLPDPDVAVKADENGNEWALYRPERAPATVPPGAPVGIIEREEEPKEFRFVHRQYIVGKGFWIWWPRGRWFRLIR